MKINMIRILFACLGLISMLSCTGCIMFYTGSEEGPYRVVAERDEPGVPKETVLCASGKANWYVLMGPDGCGEETYFRSLRYYMAANGKTNSLSRATMWAYNDKEVEGAVPVPGTDRWMLAYCTHMSADLVTLDVRLFTARKLIARHEIANVLRDSCREKEKYDLIRYGVCTFSENRKSFVFPTTDGDCVMDATTGELKLPEPLPDLAAQARRVKQPGKGISLYDLDEARILWTMPDDHVLSSRSDTNTFITATRADDRTILRLRDGAGKELIRREVPCKYQDEIAVSPNFRRVAYTVERTGQELPSFWDEKRDASLCVETYDGDAVSKKNVFDFGVGRTLSFCWITDDILVANWQKRPKDYDHHDLVIINARTGQWRVLPFGTCLSRGLGGVDVATGRAILPAYGGKRYVYDAASDAITATIDLSLPEWPKDPGCWEMVGVENGVGMVFAGLRTWMLVDWNGKLVKSGPLNRSGVGNVNGTLGHGRLLVGLSGEKYEYAVLTLDNKMPIKGVTCRRYEEGKLLLE